MKPSKNNGPVVLIIVTSLVLYSVMRSKKMSFLGKKWRHHIINPSMKTPKIKSIVDREVKRAVEH